jgi:PilZ domain
MVSTPDSAPTHGPERRREIRISFAPARRPSLVLADGAYQVLDMSVRGLRIRHFESPRPMFGAPVTGTLQPRDERSPVPVRGHIVRVQTADVAIRCEEGTVPMGWILEEVSAG